MKQLKRTLLTLVALIAVTTGAWAQTASYQMKELVPPKEWENAGMLYVTDMPSDFKAISIEEAEAWTGAPTTGTAYIFYAFDGSTSLYLKYTDGTPKPDWTGWTKGHIYDKITAGDFVVYYPAKPAYTPVAITWDDATKTATIDKMPAGNVTVTPAYFKQAEFADQGAPKAEKDVLANTDAPLVSEGQVKNIDGTETPQGTVMYYAAQQDGNTIPDAPDYDADGWTDQVPTADGLQEGKVYVWYYILGAEPAQGTDRTDDNTCSDSNITPLGTDGYVELGPEPVYTVEFAEGTNEAPNSWTVDPTEATDPGVTKDTKVTLTYQGPRKVIGVKAEKKAAAGPVPFALNISNPAVDQVIGSDGKNYAYTSLPKGVTAVAKICFVDGNNGLALAMADENGEMDWGAANTAAAAHEPACTSGGTWRLANGDEWEKMFDAASGASNLRDGFSSVGGTNMQASGYWSSNSAMGSYHLGYLFGGSGWQASPDNSQFYVRACLAF